MSYDLTKVREIAARSGGRLVESVRYLLSCTPGCEALADKLRGDSGTTLHEAVTNAVLGTLGEGDLPKRGKASQVIAKGGRFGQRDRTVNQRREVERADAVPLDTQ
jgi:hypothetical protein